MSVKGYKGFNKDMTCKGFQYEEGKEYETDTAKVCECGFHACEYPLDVFDYYSPNESVYHEVEQSGDISKAEDDTKVSSTKIKIGASINIAGLVKAAIEYTMKRTNKKADSDDDYGAASSTGYKGAASSTGDYGAASSTGDYGAASSTGYKGAASSTGSCGAASSTGYKGAASADNPSAVAVAWGYKSKAKGVKGSYLVFADWECDENKYWKPDSWSLKGAKMVQVDGEWIKENTWYVIENGTVKKLEE
jgi:hypothetical protein